MFYAIRIEVAEPTTKMFRFAKSSELEWPGGEYSLVSTINSEADLLMLASFDHTENVARTVTVIDG